MEEQKPIRIAHISDVHVSRLTYSPKQFFSKQWLGNLNLILNRRYTFHHDPQDELIHLFADLNVDHVVISGDMSSTSLDSEFEAGRRFVDAFHSAGMQVHLVPGNHDNYTKYAFENKLFYRHFGDQKGDTDSPLGDHSMADDQITIRKLGPGWWWVGLDTTIAAGLLRSNGVFSRPIEKKLSNLLKKLPEEDAVLLTCHFPLSTTHPSHDMHRVKALRNLLTHSPNVKLYLHGHIHRQSITDCRPKGLPIILNSGSCGFKRNATCHIVDLLPQACHIQVFRHLHHKHATPSEPWGLHREAAYGW